MPRAILRGVPAALHPLHALLLAFPVALFPAALATDVAYFNSAEMQWSNFAAWLIAGGVLFCGLAFVWGVVRVAIRRPGSAWLTLILALLFLVGLINSFQHSHDGWTSVGITGLVLSAISAILALAAGWTGYSARQEAHP
ncbi:DUF2231 domain-containing protein [Novosphingobium sp. BL-8H]|uniref:DUF2231 domain-containing protein n=1 Tax=Novosphingobium sp. BL-8H TaxID=3127640 RepID=UPI0037563E9D